MTKTKTLLLGIGRNERRVTGDERRVTWDEGLEERGKDEGLGTRGKGCKKMG